MCLRCLRHWLSIALCALLPGCAPAPMLKYDSAVPAQTLSLLQAPVVQDARGRFREIFCTLVGREPDIEGRTCSQLLHRLSDELAPSDCPRPLAAHDPQLALLFVPGLFSDCTNQFVRPFAGAIERLRRRGYAAEIIPVSGRSSPSHNAPIIAHAVQQQLLAGRQRVVLIGHSKGAVDSLEFLLAYPDLAAQVVAVVSVAGAINGSPLGEALSNAYRGWLAQLDISQCPPGDGGAVSSLRRSERLRWLAEHGLPRYTRYYSLAAFTSYGEMHFPLRLPYSALAEIDPRNDGQLLYFDQVIPGSTLLGYANADHWAVAADIEAQSPLTTSFLTGEFSYPSDLLAEALVLFVVEDLGRAEAAQ